MRSRIIIILGLLWTVTLSAQVQNDVKEILSKKNFISFKIFADTLPSKERHVYSYWTIFRDITPDFKEGVFYFTQTVPDGKNPGINSLQEFRVRLLTADKTIIYYELGKKINQKVKKDWTHYYDTRDQYKNDSLFSVLQQSFKNTFDGELNESELFMEDIVVGKSCGYIGDDPKEKTMIDKLAAEKNKEELFKWLKSANFEKQVYALDGLFQLKESGTSYTEEELRIIKNVRDKKGNVHQCRGCEYRWIDVKAVNYKFKFE